jgi:hypothetical protein
MRGYVAVCLGAVGILFLTGAVWFYHDPGLKAGDESVAFAPLYRDSLKRFESMDPAIIIVTTPAGARWSRIRRAWGDPGYVIATISDAEPKTMYSTARLGLTVQVLRGSNRLQTESVNTPLYGYSAEGGQIGTKFNASPNEQITIRVQRNDISQPMPKGSLVVTAYWTQASKDKLAGLELDRELRTPILVVGFAGVLCLLLAGYLFVFKRLPFRAA